MLGVLQIGHADKLPAKNGKSNLLRKYIDCCFFKILSCHSVYLSHAILSRRSFVAALFCRGALLSLRSFVAALILRLSFVARSFVARSNVVDSCCCVPFVVTLINWTPNVPFTVIRVQVKLTLIRPKYVFPLFKCPCKVFPCKLEPQKTILLRSKGLFCWSSSV
jgi:hypothetical protein